jgi:hypothetical protein
MAMRAAAALLFALPLAGALAAAPSARADDKPSVVVWPTLTPAGDAPSATPLHRPEASDKQVFERAQELDATLRDAVEDLGFTLYVADEGPAAGHTRDADLVERAGRSPLAGGAGGTWVVSPRIEPLGGGAFLVRVIAVPPRGDELRVRVASVAGDSVSVRGLVMLRDLLSSSAAARAAAQEELERSQRGTSQGIMSPLRSQGRAVLAVNAGLFGGFTAFSMQRASGSDDPRVLYPLLALGTGVGIGGALLVADEWDVTTGDAFYLAAGGWWGAASGLLIANGRSVQPFDDRYAWGVGGGLAGVTLATLALTRTPMDEGDATLAHSGGAFGLLLGGAVELLDRGTTELTPNTGMGYGAAIGVLAAGALATRVTVSPSRVLLVDLGVGGGALLGAAAASPLVFQNATPANTRGWLSATLAGSAVGGVAAWWLTRDGTPAGAASWLDHSRPLAGILGISATREGGTPIYGAGWSGEF